MTTPNGAKVVVITGCSTGIGFSLALLLARDADCRFKVYATMRNLGKKGALEKEAGALLNETLFIKQLDVSVDEQIDSLVGEVVETEGMIDILVNNAGIGMFAPIETQSIAEVRALFATNVFGPILLTKKVLPLWKKKKTGHVIMVSSICGIVGFPFNSAYCASKAALEGFSESLSSECSGSKIKVSLIEPGPVSTEFEKNTHQDMQDLEKLDEETRALFQIVTDNKNNTFATMSQTPEDIAEHILNAIENTKPALRCFTNKMFSAAVQRKFKL